MARPVFSLKAIEIGAFFAYFHHFSHFKVIQLSKILPKHFIFNNLSDIKNRLKIALQFSKSGFSPKVMPSEVFYRIRVLFLLIPKAIGNRKKRLRVRLRSGDKHYLRKSADRKAQISPVSGTNASRIRAFRSADSLRWCLSSERNLTHNLFSFSISNSF